MFVRSIPNTDYSFRLFPGSRRNNQYCLDFVLTETGEAINSPLQHKLLMLPPKRNVWHVRGAVTLWTVGSGAGIPASEEQPGSEYYILNDGWKCMLTRPELPNMCFTVPVRRA